MFPHYPQIIDDLGNCFSNENFKTNQNHSFQIICDGWNPERNFVIKIKTDIVDDEQNDTKQNDHDHEISPVKFIEFKNISSDYGVKNLVKIEKSGSKFEYLFFHGWDKTEFHQLNCKTKEWESLNLPENMTKIKHAFGRGESSFFQVCEY